MLYIETAQLKTVLGWVKTGPPRRHRIQPVKGPVLDPRAKETCFKKGFRKWTPLKSKVSLEGPVFGLFLEPSLWQICWSVYFEDLTSNRCGWNFRPQLAQREGLKASLEASRLWKLQQNKLLGLRFVLVAIRFGFQAWPWRGSRQSLEESRLQAFFHQQTRKFCICITSLCLVCICCIWAICS